MQHCEEYPWSTTASQGGVTGLGNSMTGASRWRNGRGGLGIFALGRIWRKEVDWVNRLGLILGIWWVVYLFSGCLSHVLTMVLWRRGDW